MHASIFLIIFNYNWHKALCEAGIYLLISLAWIDVQNCRTRRAASECWQSRLFFNITCILTMFWLLYCSLSMVLSSTVMVIVYLDILHHGIMKLDLYMVFCLRSCSCSLRFLWLASRMSCNTEISWYSCRVLVTFLDF